MINDMGIGGAAVSTTTMVGSAKAGEAQRYSPSMQALHWVVALLMFSVVPLAWVMVSMPKDAAARNLFFMLHKSIGITILVLAAVRLIIRASRPIPPEPAGTPRWMAVSAVASHWLLYGVLFAMPISGYISSTTGPYGVNYFGLFNLPQLPQSQVLSEDAISVHLVLQWAVYALIAVHVLATAWHVVVRRDGLLARELPYQRLN